MFRNQRHAPLIFWTGFFLLFWVQACAPRQPYRSAGGPRSFPSSTPPLSQSLPSAKTAAPHPQPAWEEAKIRESDIKGEETFPQTGVRERPLAPTLGRETAPSPFPDDSSLIAKITPATSARRAASLRLTEEGKRLLEAGQYAKALNRLEKTIAIDSTNPYSYYYLAKTHYHQGRYQDSLNFLDVAESRLVNEPYWLAEVYSLRGENYRALGSHQRAEFNYSKALQLNPGNRTASDALTRIQIEAQPQPR